MNTMANLSTRFKELVWIRNKDPENVIIERNDIHHFYWRFEFNSFLGPLNPDFEPIMVDLDANVGISRIHWEGLIIWLSPLCHKQRPIADFHTENHIPVLLTKSGSYRRKGDPKNILTRIYLKIFFEPFIEAMLNGKHDLSTQTIKTYGNKVTNSIPIPEESKLLNGKYNLIMLIGDLTSIDKVPRLRLILSEFQMRTNLLNIINFIRPG
jgi:hypothetical protein